MVSCNFARLHQLFTFAIARWIDVQTSLSEPCTITCLITILVALVRNGPSFCSRPFLSFLSVGTRVAGAQFFLLHPPYRRQITIRIKITIALRPPRLTDPLLSSSTGVMMATNGSSQPTCQNCSTSTTPLWRRDEFGSVLCNACGLFLKLHGRPRPISLKTDVIKSRNRVKTMRPDLVPKKKVCSCYLTPRSFLTSA